MKRRDFIASVGGAAVAAGTGHVAPPDASRFTRGTVATYIRRQVWVPSHSIAGDHVADYVSAARAHGCQAVLWNDTVRDLDSDFCTRRPPWATHRTT